MILTSLTPRGPSRYRIRLRWSTCSSTVVVEAKGPADAARVAADEHPDAVVTAISRARS